MNPIIFHIAAVILGIVLFFFGLYLNKKEKKYE